MSTITPEVLAAESTTDWRQSLPAHAHNRALEVLLSSVSLAHVEHIPPRAASSVPFPSWVPSRIVGMFARRGLTGLWSHQAEAAAHAAAGRHVIVATPAASGKSLAYLLPALTAIAMGETVLYVTPSKALAADQLAVVSALWAGGRRPGGRRYGAAEIAAVLDGDATRAERDWARSHARYLLTTPDMLHYGVLPAHFQWSGFFSRLRYVIIDECHEYRGVFGSHVAQVLRRLRRVVAHHGGRPAFILASATISEPGASARLLTGLPVTEVTADGSPRGPLAFALFEPSRSARRRRTATAHAAELLARLVRENVQTLVFVPSRRGAETVAIAARRHLDDDMTGQVAAYRSGYLAADRRLLEMALGDGRLTGMAATTALELGIDISGLDAVLIAGWPGSWASLWQQAGRAGRDGQAAAAVLIARDDPLDTYLVRHPEVVLRHPVETPVLDPANEYVLAPHLAAAAAELPLTEADLDLFGPAAPGVVASLTSAGRLRPRQAGNGGAGWYATRRERTGLRGSGPGPVRVIEAVTGRLIGTVDEPSAPLLVHDGAVYLHQGETYLVDSLNLDDRVALVTADDPGYTTSARVVTEITVGTVLRHEQWQHADLRFGEVSVARRITGYTQWASGSGAPLGEMALDLPVRPLTTRATWWTVGVLQRDELVASGADVAGAAHAVEHAAIALLPLFATCDRWDVGGASADEHQATGQLSIFVYDGHYGGAGFAERGFLAARPWLAAVRQAIADCFCEAGCPSCVHSPNCGRGNHPLSKRGAKALLDLLLSGTR